MADHDDQINPQEDYENLGLRLLFMIIIGVLMGFAQTLINLLAIGQFIVMLVNKREPNEQLTEFGDSIGMWLAKASRYQSAASELKPWPWTHLD